MNAAGKSLVLVVTLVFNLAILALMLRVLLQWVRADYYNPITQTIVRVTKPLLAPLRPLIPIRGNLDLAALLVLFVLEVLGIMVLGLVYGVGIPPVLPMLLWAVLGLINFFLNFYFFAIIAMVILSWVAPGSGNPAVYLLFQLTEPVMAPFRKLLPSLGGLDLSPILVFVAIQIAQFFVADAAQGVGLLRPLVIGI